MDECIIMAITVKTKDEIEILREGGQRLARVLEKVLSEVRVGISTDALDKLAESLIFESGGIPSFKGYTTGSTKTPYPASICTSINDEVVHGIPRKDRILKDGDIIGVDIGMKWPAKKFSILDSQFLTKPLFTDMAVTVGVGKISQEAERLIRVTKESLDIGVGVVSAGIKTGDIGYVIQKYLEKHKLGVIRDLAGHGVGYKVHEEPLIPNFGSKGTGCELVEGMVIAIEPIAALGNWKITPDKDEWTLRTSDGSLAAHFEHTMAVTKTGREVLTKDPLQNKLL